MSKISGCISLLNILSGGITYQIKDLAEILEVTPRMVRFYKEELEKSGIFIETIRGRYGGYYLKNDIFIPNIKLNDEDLNFLREQLNYLDDKNRQKMSEILDKIKGIKIEHQSTHFQDDDTRNKYNLLTKSIRENRKVYIEYTSFTKGLTKRVIHPFQIIWYQNGLGCAAFCEKRQDLRHFELKRIELIEVLEEKFK